MSKAVFDSSAILALFYNETGKPKVLSLLDEYDPLISAANFCEIVTKLISDGLVTDVATEMFSGLEIDIIDFDAQHAIQAAELRPITEHLGLSLGDRTCLALAIQENATAITADRTWSNLDVCRIVVIR